MHHATTSRRTFLRATGAALGGVLVAGSAPPRARSGRLPTDRTGDRQVGFALAGLGSLSMNQLVPALGETRFARLAGVVTGTPAKGRRMVEQYGVPADAVYDYATMGRMRENPDIDVVFVVTPNGLHREHTIAAARAGKHVLCEKPMANTAADCEAMISACRDAGVRLMIGYRCQYEPHHVEAIRLAREKVFGELRFIEAGFGFTIGDPRQWRLRKDLAGGGALMDVGVYALQACRYIAGEEPISVTAVETKTDPVKFAEVDETVCWQMRFPSGVVASATTTYHFGGLNGFTAYASDGSFGLGPAFGYGGIEGQTSRGPIRFEATNHFASEIDDFALCLLEGRPSRTPGEEGLADLRVIEAIYESIRTGRAVEVG